MTFSDKLTLILAIAWLVRWCGHSPGVRSAATVAIAIELVVWLGYIMLYRDAA